MQSKGETIPLDSEEGGEGSQHSEEEDTRSGEKGAHQESHDQSQKESREDVNGERQGNKIESEEEQDDITPQIRHQPAPLKAEEQDTQPRSTVTQGIHQDNGREQVKGQEGAQDNTHKVKGQSGTKELAENQGEQGVTEQGRNEQDTEQMDDQDAGNQDGDSGEYLESRGPAMLQQRVQETGVKEKEEREGGKEEVKKDEQEEEEEESGNSGSSGEEEGKCMAENPEDCKDPNPFPSEEQEPNYGMC